MSALLDGSVESSELGADGSHRAFQEVGTPCTLAEGVCRQLSVKILDD